MRRRTLSPLLTFQFLSIVSARVLPNIIVERDATPAPIVWAASQNWDGDDGSWSSFALQVGTPPQNVRVLISTASWQTVAVLSGGCSDTNSTNCKDSRGGIYDPSQSSTWEGNIDSSSTHYPLQVGTGFNSDTDAVFGFDDISLGSGGSTSSQQSKLKNQTIGGFVASDTYLGLFGLTPRASNFSSKNPVPSFLQNLRSKSMIPSLSWAYTAGNQYRLNNVLGSLTLGGYDRSKFIANNVTWAFGSEDARDLTVQIESITATDQTNQASLLTASIPAFLDSSLPFIWLPEEACALFETAFNLTWDKETELYLLNDTEHNALVARNPTITFTLGNLTPGAQVNITLPYSAFDLLGEPPFIPTASRYFPLKRTTNSSQYTLGRTFFQEAYVIADYERASFSISQCSWDASLLQDIVTIQSPQEAAKPSHRNPIGALAGAAVGLLVAIVLISTAILTYYLYNKKLRRAVAITKAALEKKAQPEPDTPIIFVTPPPQSPSQLILPATLAPPVQETVPYAKPELDTISPSTLTISPFTPSRQAENFLVEPPRLSRQQIYEMSAIEEVAAEMTSPGNAIEMATSFSYPRFSFTHTPQEMCPPPRYWPDIRNVMAIPHGTSMGLRRARRNTGYAQILEEVTYVADKKEKESWQNILMD